MISISPLNLALFYLTYTRISLLSDSIFAFSEFMYVLYADVMLYCFAANVLTHHSTKLMLKLFVLSSTVS